MSYSCPIHRALHTAVSQRWAAGDARACQLSRRGACVPAQTLMPLLAPCCRPSGSTSLGCSLQVSCQPCKYWRRCWAPATAPPCGTTSRPRHSCTLGGQVLEVFDPFDFHSPELPQRWAWLQLHRPTVAPARHCPPCHHHRGHFPTSAPACCPGLQAGVCGARRHLEPRHPPPLARRLQGRGPRPAAGRQGCCQWQPRQGRPSSALHKSRPQPGGAATRPAAAHHPADSGPHVCLAVSPPHCAQPCPCHLVILGFAQTGFCRLMSPCLHCVLLSSLLLCAVPGACQHPRLVRLVLLHSLIAFDVTVAPHTGAGRCQMCVQYSR